MKKNIKVYVLLNVILLVYSFSNVFSKLASSENFMSSKFIIFYLLVIICLGIYAIGWQQVIKKIPLTSAFANKAITIVWGVVLGFIIFNENITFLKIVGAMLVIVGLVINALPEKGDHNE